MSSSSATFLSIDNQPISIAQVVQYLRLGRKFEGFIGEIIRQYVLEQEMTHRDDLQINPAVLEQAIVDFRLERQLTDAKKFQEWLGADGLTYEGFREQIEYGFKLRNLRELVTEPRLQEYFIERKLYLDRVVLSRIIVDSKDLAEELSSQMSEGSATFEQLAREYSLTDDRMVNGMVGPVSRGTMPDELRAAIDLAKPGDIVGPLGMDSRWGLFRVEELLPTSLDDNQTRSTLRDELFERWLAEKMEVLPIRLTLDED